jgi:hypothetical protein
MGVWLLSSLTAAVPVTAFLISQTSNATNITRYDIGNDIIVVEVISSP